MDLADRLQDLADKIVKQRPHIATEEAVKNAFVLPFIAALGYDVFNPLEVIPEFVADVGTKKGEKVDYAIMRDGKVAMLIECKQNCERLDISHASQLYRYFSVTEARIAILTDGCTYRIFTDLERANQMDPKPFMEFDLLALEEQLLPEIKKLSREEFDLDKIMDGAGELKYTREIRRILGSELSSPSPELVKLLTGRVYSGRFTEGVRDQFTEIVKRAFQQFVHERIKDRLQSALSSEDITSPSQPSQEATPPEEAPAESSEAPEIVTTEEELEGFHIVKAITRKVIAPDRIGYRDLKSYMGILIDDNNRKPLCRLHFNTGTRYLGLFDEEKNETRVALESLDDIYEHAEALRETAGRYVEE